LAKHPKPDERGFALLLVLWSLVALTSITAMLLSRGREDVKLASNLRLAAFAETLADSGVHEALFRLLDLADTGWRPGPVPYRIDLPGGRVAVMIEDQAAYINPNTANDALLSALLAAVGADAGTSRDVAAAIEDWRSAGTAARQYGARAAEYRAAGRNYGPPGTPFRTTEELGLVLGMTPDLLARLSPHVSVLQDNEPDPAIADPIVLSALQKAGLAGDVRRAPSAGRVVAITAVANTPGGGRFARRATVRLGASPTGKLFQILDWRRVAG